MTEEDNSNNKGKTKEESKIFTLNTDESDNSDMPSVTRLLNRKSLNLATHAKKDSPAPPQPQPPLPNTQKASEPSPPSRAPRLQIKSTPRKQSNPPPPLNIWDPAQLKGSADPLGKGISLMIEKGAHCAFFLGIAPPPPGTKIPQFLSSAAVLPGKRLAIWSGLRWDPSKSLEVWNELLKTQYMEFPPPGSHTQIDSQRNVLRAAFGINPDEYLLLARAGPAAAFRGIVIFLSKKSLLLEMKSVVSLLQKALP